MPTCCAVIKCGNRSGRDKKSFFRLPVIPSKGSEKKRQLIKERRIKWLCALKRSDLDENKTKHIRICQDHFLTGNPADVYDINHPDWVPSKNLGYGNKSDFCQKMSRYNRAQNRMASETEGLNSSLSTLPESAVNEFDEQIDAAEDLNSSSCFNDFPALAVDDNAAEDLNSSSCFNDFPALAVDDNAAEDLNSSSCFNDFPALAVDDDADWEPIRPSSFMTAASCQTDLTMEDINKLEDSLKHYVEDTAKLKHKLSNYTLSENSFVNNNEKVVYYTGLLNFTILLNLFTLIEPLMKTRDSVTKFQQFILTLMHLRLNLDFTDLAYRFMISRRTVTRSFYECLGIMYTTLKKFVYWPENLKDDLPKLFIENFGSRVAVIIDCFEIRTERPTNPLASATTWSNYKHNNTIKFLIGISPHGMITFISSAWGGRASDKHIVEHCGILEKLLPDETFEE